MPRKGFWTEALKALAVFILYFTTAKLGLALAAINGLATLVWPPTGIALATVLLFGYRFLPCIALGAFAVNFSAGAPWYAALGIATGNTLEAFVGAYLLRRSGFETSFSRVREVIKFVVLGAFVSPWFSSVIGVASLKLSGWITFKGMQETWIAWWLGDFTGALIVAPFLLIWGSSVRPRPPLLRIGEAAAFAIVVVLTCSAIFPTLPLLRLFDLKHIYYVYPLLLWASLRFQQRGAVTAILIVSSLTIWGSLLGVGPFAASGLHESLIQLQEFMSIFAMTGLTLAAAITERFHAEDALREALRHRDDFLSVASHELRTPVTSLHLQLQLLQSSLGLDGESSRMPGELARSFRTFERSILRLTELLDKLLDVTRIRVKSLELNPEVIDLCATVQEVVARFSADADRARTEIILMASGEVKGCWDPSRIDQVVANLVSNAIKYGSSKPVEVRVEADRERGEAIFRVCDQGLGIAPELRPRLFERFERADTARRTPGLGLGLYISRKIVDAHGGTIAVESATGKGSVFTVRLPLS